MPPCFGSPADATSKAGSNNNTATASARTLRKIPSTLFRSQLADWYGGYHGAALEQPAKSRRGLAIRTKRNPCGGTCDDLPQPLRCSALIASQLATLPHRKKTHLARRSARSCCPR